MFFLSRSDLDKRFRQLRLELQQVGISEDLRGWNWNTPPVEPPLKNLFLPVSDLASRYCDSLRDIYLKRIERVYPPPGLKMVEGLVYHKVASEATLQVKKLLFEKGLISGSTLIDEIFPRATERCRLALEEAVRATKRLSEEEFMEGLEKTTNFYRFLIVQAAAQLDRILAKFPHADVDSVVNVAIPPVVERKVDGSLIGLSRELSVDIYAPAYAVADLKTGEVRGFHKYALTGYALALEADEEASVNFGVTIYAKMVLGRQTPTIGVKPFLIGDELRREFLEIRDNALEIIQNARDPGKPSVCPGYCPYYGVCG